MIKVTKKYYIGADKYQFVVCEKKIREKNNEVYYHPLCYYADLKPCFEAIRQMLLKNKIIKYDMDILTAIEEYKKISNYISKMFNENFGYTIERVKNDD